jgi:hypothetical protein
MTPYCHCKVPLKVWSYRIGAAMPGIILGLVPMGIGLLTGSIGFMLFGILFTIAAGGDALILWLIRNVKKHEMVQDHPDKVGCYVIEHKLEHS